MKLMHTFDITEGMSMNSLKPSINSNPESSLDPCVIKDVDNCILTKEMHSQSNGERQLYLTNFDIDKKETAKKMFEQVNYNSSKSISDVQVKKDSWNCESAYDSSEKENVGNSSEVRFDILSVDNDDDDDEGSIHLKISEEDSSSEDYEINAGHKKSVKDLSACRKDAFDAQDETLCKKRVESSGEKHDRKSCQEENSLDKQDILSSKGNGTIHEKSVEELELVQLRSQSHDTSCVVDNAEKVVPASNSHVAVNSKGDLGTSDPNPRLRNEDCPSDFEENMSEGCVLEVVSNCSKSVDSDDESALVDGCDESLNEIGEFEGKGYGLPIGNEESHLDLSNEENLDSEKEDALLADDWDSAVGLDDNPINDSGKMDDGILQHTDVPDSEAKDVADVASSKMQEVEVLDTEEDEEEEEEENLVKAPCKEQNVEKEALNSDKVLEILEYQPANEEATEFQAENVLADDICESSDKPSTCSDVNCTLALPTNENAKKVIPEDLEKFPESSESNIKDIAVAAADSDGAAAAAADDDGANSTKKNICVNSEIAEKERDTLQPIEEVTPVNKSNDSEERDVSYSLNVDDLKRKKTSCEVKLGCKRNSDLEEILVNYSKRTKLDSEEECDVSLCESTKSDQKCTQLDTKETCDNRSKRLLNNVSDDVEVKKFRVVPHVSLSDKKSACDRKGGHLESEGKNENVKEKRLEACDEDLKLNPLPFLRNRAQLQKLSRNDLEELVLQKICEAITERSQCGELRELAQNLEEKLRIWQRKSLQLSKQVKDLNYVLKRFESDLRKKTPNAAPFKVTRSVGLQVQWPGSSRKAASPMSKGPSSPSAKGAEGGEGAGLVRPAAQTSQPGAKVVQVKSVQPLSSSSNKTPTSNKLQSPTSNIIKTSSDHQVIDLTEEMTKRCANNMPVVTIAQSSTSVQVPIAHSLTTSVSNSPPGGNCRSIRVLPQLSSATSSILTPTGTTSVEGQRLAYFVPSTNVPVQQRHLIFSSSPQVRPAGVLSMSQRQNPLPAAILLKPGYPVSPVPVSGSSLIRTSSITSTLQLASSRVQQRAGPLLQHFPINTSALSSSALSVVQSSGVTVSSVSHPAPLPVVPVPVAINANWKLSPPKPDLKISKAPNRNQQGIVLSWNMTMTGEHEEIASYQLFAYQEGTAPASTHLWKKVGDVKALPLPMACTLTQFMEGHKYHFAVRAVDVHARYGPFSTPGNIVLTRN